MYQEQNGDTIYKFKDKLKEIVLLCILYKTNIYVRNLVICIFLQAIKDDDAVAFLPCNAKIRRLNEFSKTKIRYHKMSEDTQKPVINSHFKYFFQNRFPTAEKNPTIFFMDALSSVADRFDESER
ncbi:hypothetical protein CEXT_365281 [Caerostris extrusa]|uniref:Uncharacterized protein n=1 Tax=Caerostris extrusa TaxID=172846 RepID=A0AAV4QDM5_CAEEX|nr:hypothetical protein CEXT_365281 [Caerostris extrusa]